MPSSFGDLDALHLAVVSNEQLAVGKSNRCPVLRSTSDSSSDTSAVPPPSPSNSADASCLNSDGSGSIRYSDFSPSVARIRPSTRIMLPLLKLG